MLMFREKKNITSSRQLSMLLVFRSRISFIMEASLLLKSLKKAQYRPLYNRLLLQSSLALIKTFSYVNLTCFVEIHYFEISNKVVLLKGNSEQ